MYKIVTRIAGFVVSAIAGSVVALGIMQPSVFKIILGLILLVIALFFGYKSGVKQ